MENKRKNIYIAIFIITTIIASVLAFYFGIIQKQKNDELKSEINDLKQNLNNQDQNTNNTNNTNNDNKNKETIKKNEAKQLILNDNDKAKHNKLLSDNANILQLIITNKEKYDNNYNPIGFENGKFDDEDKLNISVIVSYKTDIQGFENNSENFSSGGPMKYVKKDYLNNYSKQIFNEEINFSNITSNTTNNEVAVNLPTGLGIYSFKVKSLILNENTNEYTLTFDSIDTSKVQDYLNDNTTNYDNSAILDTYVLKYKKINENNIILSLDRTYHK